jgi:hypothetical protein
LAKVAKAGRDRHLFQWKRLARTRDTGWRGNRDYDDPVNCRLWVPAEDLLCVEAYVPGDFRPFFADPRTRADYLQWAPLLLTAEDWHAGRSERLDKEEE